jgi:catechol 2,3-dioxygenase-like lactoylglutathione lyase family enzyme
MHVNHLDLHVGDLDEAVALFTGPLGMALVARKADAIAVLDDGAGFTLAVSNHAKFGGAPGAPPEYPDGFHLGFLVETAGEVDARHAQLSAVDGVDAGRPPRAMRQTYGFYFTALGGLLFEVACPRAS